MKKIIPLLFVVLLLCFSSMSVFAASDTSSQPEMSVTITSPTSIESKPICEENIEITVKNLTDHELTNLAAYLMILDEGRNMTYPVDEFGQNAYQTRNIASIPENGEVKVTIPVKITYVGNFKFNVSVINYNNDYVTTSNTLSVKMIENSKMNKAIVMTVAAVIPIALTCVALIIVKRKKLKK